MMKWCKNFLVQFENHAQNFSNNEALRKAEEFETINLTEIYEQEGVTIEKKEIFINVRTMPTFLESKGVITIEDGHVAKGF